MKKQTKLNQVLLNSVELLDKEGREMEKAIKKGAYKGKQLRRTTWQCYSYRRQIATLCQVLLLLGEGKKIKKVLKRIKITRDYHKAFDAFEKTFKRFYRLR